MPEETLETSQPTESKSTDWVKVVLVSLGAFTLLGLSSYAGYWYGKESSKLKVQSSKLPSETQTQPTPTPTFEPTPAPDPTASWEVYTSSEYGFSFRYPPNFSTRQVGWSPYLYGEQADFYLYLVQDVYKDQTQNPEITVSLIKTDKAAEQYVGNMQSVMDEANGELQDPDNIYFGANPARITGNTAVTVDGTSAIKIERFAGPGAPNASYTDYIVRRGDHLYVLSANYGTNNPDLQQDGTIEKNTLDQILSTFQFLD